MALRKKHKQKTKEPNDGTHFYEICYLCGEKFKTTFITASKIAVVDEVLMVYDNLNGQEILSSVFSHWVSAQLDRASKKMKRFENQLDDLSRELSDSLEEDY